MFSNQVPEQRNAKNEEEIEEQSCHTGLLDLIPNLFLSETGSPKSIEYILKIFGKSDS
ncbi:MAG TPA: hypothetical protein VFV68_01620 [Agriterribacter sp.]|nr:hypothetical protein [Agriterribacter sp.]